MELWVLPVIGIGIILLVEIIFRLIYRRRYNRDYHVSIKFAWNRNHVVTHPFLSFAYKKHELIDKNQRLPYEIHPNKYFSFKEPLRLNNMGHFGQDFETEKPSDVLRIACLGDSTTANSISDGIKDYSYPKLLEEYLRENLHRQGYTKRVEVYNCGIGGWVSVDIFTDFVLNILPTKPDYIILCHGFTDLHLYLMENFCMDYSHGRYNLGERIGRIRRAYYLPKISFWHSYECLKDRVLGTGNVRNDVIEAVRKQAPNLDKPYKNLEVEKNILRNILVLCRYYGIGGILSTYPFYLYKSDATSRKMAEGVSIENRQCRELAAEMGFILVDQAELIPYEYRYFLDWVHLTPKGMQIFATNLAEALIQDLRIRGELSEREDGKC